MPLGLISLVLAVLFYSFLVLVFPIQVPPTTKSEKLLKEYAFQLGKEAKWQGRKSMSQNDKNRIVSFAGVSNWQDLNVLSLFSEFNRGLKS